MSEALPLAKRAAPPQTSASLSALHSLSKTANYHMTWAFYSPAKPPMLWPQTQRLVYDALLRQPHLPRANPSTSLKQFQDQQDFSRSEI